MVLPVSKVVVHHEGAGVPRDGTDLGYAGYTVEITPTIYRILRAPDRDFATKDWNHRVASIVFTGDRTSHPLSFTEIFLFHAACADLMARNWLTRDCTAVPHRWSPGSATACPGQKVIDVWPTLVAQLVPVPAPIAPPRDPGPLPPDWAAIARQTAGILATKIVNSPKLARGATGPLVKDLQTALGLISRTSFPTADGTFGPTTEHAVRKFQRFVHLVPDGIVGRHTWQALAFFLSLRAKA